jgi:hypothetical protein
MSWVGPKKNMVSLFIPPLLRAAPTNKLIFLTWLQMGHCSLVLALYPTVSPITSNCRMEINENKSVSSVMTFSHLRWSIVDLTGSLWRRRLQQSFNTSTRFYFPSLTTCFGPYRPSSGEIYNGLFLIQWIRCTYATWCRDVTCCTSVSWLCIPNTCYHLDINIKIVDIKL